MLPFLRRTLRGASFGTLALVLAGCVPAASPASVSSSARPPQAATPAVGAERPSTLRVGVIPNQAPDKVRAQYQPFQEHLSKTLDQPVELFVATDYAGVVEALASDKLDLAYFGGLTYLQAERRAQLYPIVTEVDRETKTTRYYSAIITRADSPIQKVEDIKGKKFAFGDINSTSGSLYPRLMLDQAGLSDFTNPSLFVYTGGHDATVLAVQNGTVDAGGVERRIMNRLIEAGTADRSKLRIVQEMLVEGYPWCVRARLDPALVEQITSAFLAIKDADLLKLMRAEAYARVSAKDYDQARVEAVRLGLVR
ncbi:MAG: phosphate/phosphite/phosphonate ABC transporter substrate-binding protein [Chloroflexi bacterium]|nr:phosphate/phosphite/phosphonate ABC transporter substrate-binding protein [Chloroflexota bacterium]